MRGMPMRFYTYNVGAQLVRELEITGAVDSIVHDGSDIIHLDLTTGQSLMIHLIDSHIPLYEINHIFRANTEAGHYTLFILWCDMLLPDHGVPCRLEDWHRGLLAAYGDRIYAYTIYMERLFVFPVYFERQHYRRERITRHGDPINIGALHCDVVEIELEALRGRWRVASFDGDPAAYAQQQAEPGADLSVRLRRYYDVLEIEPGADLGAIKRAYRDLARRYHPDLNISREATERMQKLNEAYDAILKALEQRRG
jgi:hypothetical protein